jgi:hypothetical protein
MAVEKAFFVAYFNFLNASSDFGYPHPDLVE